MLTPPQADQIIQQMVDTIVRKFHPDKIILFGSYARGEATKDSDVDLLVVMDYEGRKLDLLWAIREVLTDYRLPKDIVVRTPREVERYGKYIGTILFPALKEGRVLYEKN